MPHAWFETFFRGAAIEVWHRAMTPEWTLREIQFLSEHLNLTDGNRVLDVPCGTGRHAIELAKSGHRVTAIDLSGESLEIARASTAPVDWRKGDMRALDLEAASYDAAFCWGNSFGYLEYQDALAFLRSLCRALRPGGKVAVDVPTLAENILPKLERSGWFQVGDIYMLSARRYNAAASRLDVDYTFLRSGADAETGSASSYVYTAAELTRMLEASGFGEVQLFGSTDGTTLTLDNKGAIAVACRVS